MITVRLRRITPYLLLAPGLALMAIFVAYPLAHAGWLSLLRDDGNGGITGFAGLANYVKALHDPVLRSSLIVTLEFVGIGVPVSMLLGLLLALLMWKVRFKGENVVQMLFVLPIVVTPAVVGLMWKWILNPTFGVLNYYLELVGVSGPLWLDSPKLALLSVILVDVWQYTPFIFLSLLAGLRSLPSEPFEAAQIDGAVWWQTFRYVTAPLLKPVLQIVLVFRFFMALRAFDILYTMTGGGPGRTTQVLNLYIYKQGLEFSNPAYASTLSVVLLVLSIPIMLWFVRGSKQS